MTPAAHRVKSLGEAPLSRSRFAQNQHCRIRWPDNCRQLHGPLELRTFADYIGRIEDASSSFGRWCHNIPLSYNDDC